MGKNRLRGRRSAPTAMTKLGLMAVLLQQGWVERPTLAEHLDASEEPHFSRAALGKSKWFWLCMTEAELVFKKLAKADIDYIYMHMTSVYYQALVQLPDLSCLASFGPY